MSFVGTLHSSLLASRRANVLARWMAKLIPSSTRSVADVGCGDGTMQQLMVGLRPELQVTGFEILIRPGSRGNIQEFDGASLPLADQSFDVVLFVDVLHHTADPHILLREACRVARKAIVIKDHCCDGLFARPTLRFMDWIGNAHHGVALPYNYWSEAQWQQAWGNLGLVPQQRFANLGLYPWPASLWFERKLHFAAVLQPLPR